MASRAEAPIARDEMPSWLEAVIAVSLVPVVVSATVAVPSSHRPVVGALYLIAFAPFVADAFVRLPDRVRVFIPLAALFVVQAGGAAWGWIGDDIGNQTGLLIGLFVVTEAFAVACLPLAFWSLAGFIAVIMTRGVWDPDLYRAVTWWAAAAFCVGVGLLIRELLMTIVQLNEARDQIARDAVASERRRIARDVHDVVAHSMTVSNLHITAARMALERGDEPAATEALEEAEQASRASLRDVRTTVGLLRDGTESALAAPEPGLEDVDGLVESWRQAGMDVAVQHDGDADAALGAAGGLAMFRVVQESLANAARHLPSASNRVHLARRDGVVEVTVTSDGATPGPTGANGHGLVGMRERVEALGGRVDAGPDGDGWQVVASLPIDDPAVGTVAL